eukprot:scpid99559/ scgid2820/ Probable polyamine oxidase 4; Amine oxidase 2
MPPTRVVVVGAGMSGLATAAKLVEESDSAANFDVTIVEASSYVGGRVRVDHQWSDIGPIDMGGEFIHGENSILMTMAKEHDWETLAVRNPALHCTAQHCTAQHCTAQHCTAQHCTAQHSTA